MARWQLLVIPLKVCANIDIQANSPQPNGSRSPIFETLQRFDQILQSWNTGLRFYALKYAIHHSPPHPQPKANSTRYRVLLKSRNLRYPPYACSLRISSMKYLDISSMAIAKCLKNSSSCAEIGIYMQYFLAYGSKFAHSYHRVVCHFHVLAHISRQEWQGLIHSH